MYTLSSQPQQSEGNTGLFGFRLTPGTFGTAGALIVALAALHMVPWQADEAASRGLAQLLNSGPAHPVIAAAAPAPVAPVKATKPTARVAATLPAPIATTDTTAQPVVETQTISLQAGKTLATVLQDLGMVAEEAKAAMGAVHDVFDLRRLKAGQPVQITMRRTGSARNLLGLNFLAEPTRQVTVTRDASGAFDADTIKLPTERKRLAAAGTIDGGLYDAAQDAGVPSNVTRDVVKMFAHTVDFQRDIKSGAKFRIVYNQDVTKNGDKVGDGEVVYAAIEAGGKLQQLYRYEYDKGQFDYFDETGKSARRALLRTPVDNPRVTSGFGTRVHPVLGYSKMHEGVDFGAPVGAPIYAAGDGIVEKADWFSTYGRYVKLRHTNTLETAYGHMSGFAPGLHNGDKVHQGQLIGYVGQTGRATGPHLHYEVIINDNKVNPMSVSIDAGRSLTGKPLSTFKAWQQKLQADFVAQTNDKPGEKTGPQPAKVSAATAAHPANKPIKVASKD